MNRRSFLRSLTTLVAAPAIVRASSLMAISPVPVVKLVKGSNWIAAYEAIQTYTLEFRIVIPELDELVASRLREAGLPVA